MSEPAAASPDLAEAWARQEEELESLRLIYDEFVRVYADAEEAGVRVAEIKLGKLKAEADGKERLVVLRAYIGPEYPMGKEMPLFELRGVNWSRRDQNAVYEGLRELFEQQAGDVVLFQWIEWLKEELQLLPIHFSTLEEGNGNADGEEDGGTDGASTSTGGGGGAGVMDEAARRQAALDFLGGIEVIHGEPYTERKSTFQAHVGKIKTEAEAHRVIEYLLMNGKIARATHNMWAFRVWDESKNAQVNDCDDDGEDAAGGKLAELLAVMRVNNVIVVVSRWFGGVLLGPSRFRLINNTARQLLEQVCGEGQQQDAAGGGGKGAGGKKGGGSGSSKR